MSELVVGTCRWTNGDGDGPSCEEHGAHVALIW
jgi:hypothetical protein